MPKVLTIASIITCPHNPGKLTFSSKVSNKLTVQGNSVLVQGDLTDVTKTTVSGCTNNQNPCLQVKNVTDGQSSKLIVGGAPVMLDKLVGITNASGALAVTTVQGKLLAV